MAIIAKLSRAAAGFKTPISKFETQTAIIISFAALFVYKTKNMLHYVQADCSIFLILLFCL